MEAVKIFVVYFTYLKAYIYIKKTTNCCRYTEVKHSRPTAKMKLYWIIHFLLYFLDSYKCQEGKLQACHSCVLTSHFLWFKMNCRQLAL